MDKQRKRSANFTEHEKEVLVTLVQKYFDIIENKKTNAVFNKKKLECWEKLACEYNSTSTSGLRTGVQLKSAYEQFKKTAKQHKAQDKVELLKTGGGTFTPTITDFDNKVLNIIKDNYFYINNQFDSNNEALNIPSSSKEPDDTDVNTENIIIMYENYEDNKNILTDIMPKNEDPLSKKKKVCKSNVNSIEVEENGEREPSKTGGIQKKTKKEPSHWKTTDSINKKKYEILQKKYSILELIAETEKENLEGKRIETEIKEIIKQREMLELEIKKKEYNNLVSE